MKLGYLEIKHKPSKIRKQKRILDLEAELLSKLPRGTQYSEGICCTQNNVELFGYHVSVYIPRHLYNKSHIKKTVMLFNKYHSPIKKFWAEKGFTELNSAGHWFKVIILIQHSHKAFEMKFCTRKNP